MFEHQQPVLVSASCPGGMARQYRVQITSGETASQWKLMGSFRDRKSAGQYAEGLLDSGYQTRILDCASLPTAA